MEELDLNVEPYEAQNTTDDESGLGVVLDCQCADPR